MLKKRPNILFIQSDQHRFDCVGANGHPLLDTPALDRIACEGVNCTRAHTPIPLCTPARSSLLTGCWPTRHGCIANYDSEAWQPPLQGLPLCPVLLRDSGYHTAYIGKWHVDRNIEPPGYGFIQYVPEGDYGKWREAQGLPPRFSWKNFTVKKVFGNEDENALPEQSRLNWGADRVIEMLHERTEEKNTGKPWLIRWDPSEPHPPNVVPHPYSIIYDTDELKPWASFSDTLENKPIAQRQSRLNWGVQGWGWEKWRPTVARYLGEIALLDFQIGRILNALDAAGLAENTLVIYTSDHGDLCGAHGLMDKHFIMYEDVVRVPLLMRWPAGGLVGGRKCDAPIIHALDLPAAMLEAAGLPVPETFQGTSLLPWARGGSDKRRDSAFSMYFGNIFGMYSQRMVSDGKWKYVWNVTDMDELYDLENDPGELRNLAHSSAHLEILKNRRARLIQWMEETRDPLLNPWHRRVLELGTKV